ncbi:single hybrid motif-containing protein [Pleurotus eryngii]|uniref:Single hybrid motif-containing protein n=1 Tax=Pleurotus eryngii TaxID=5323 RepID=A0A9P6A760_PLEER|nr:single hybrid motif-containing protein [Pleurotus eryngii]
MSLAKSTPAISRTLYSAARGHSRSTLRSKCAEHQRVVNGRNAGIHQSSVRWAVTPMQMPAMSPTMTEGGIAQWKKQAGESFSAGDVLLEVETDKATIDVEAQEDGIMGKILLPDGTKNVSVGRVIALLAEEGDDISNLEAPKEEAALSPPSSAPESKVPASPSPSLPQTSPTSSSGGSSHGGHINISGTLFPSVQRLLWEHASSITDASQITGTGVRGMLTKGDVLAFLGLASNPLGTAKNSLLQKQEGAVAQKAVKKEEALAQALDGPALRHLIVSTMLQSSLRARNALPTTQADFNSVISDYLPVAEASGVPPSIPRPPPKAKAEEFLDGLY